jgi:uncharacterized protein YuzE
MRITYDPIADAAYIYLVRIPPGGVAETYPGDPRDKLSYGINLDFDKAGRLLGIEVLNARLKLPQEVLRQAQVLKAPVDPPRE